MYCPDEAAVILGTFESHASGLHSLPVSYRYLRGCFEHQVWVTLNSDRPPGRIFLGDQPEVLHLNPYQCYWGSIPVFLGVLGKNSPCSLPSKNRRNPLGQYMLPVHSFVSPNILNFMVGKYPGIYEATNHFHLHRARALGTKYISLNPLTASSASILTIVTITSGASPCRSYIALFVRKCTYSYVPMENNVLGEAQPHDDRAQVCREMPRA